MPNDPPLAISIKRFCRLSSLGRTKAYELIHSGELRTTKVGRRTLIDMKSVRALLMENNGETGPEKLINLGAPVHQVDTSNLCVSHTDCRCRCTRPRKVGGEVSIETGEVR